MKHIKVLTIAIFFATGTAVAMAQPYTTYDTNVDVYETAGPQFIAGGGIPINGFAQDKMGPTGQTLSVALKARDRDTGQANDIIANRYYVDAGYSTTNPSVSNLAIDFQFDPGNTSLDDQDGVDNDTDGTVDEADEATILTNYLLRLSVDFDPAVGATDFAVIDLPIFDGDTSNLNSWDDSDGYFANPGGGAWNSGVVPYVISNTTRLDFAFWSGIFGKTYDPSARGEYEIRLEAFSPNGFAQWAGITAFAVAVPEPATLGLLFLAAIRLSLVRNRRT